MNIPARGITDNSRRNKQKTVGIRTELRKGILSKTNDAQPSCQILDDRDLVQLPPAYAYVMRVSGNPTGVK